MFAPWRGRGQHRDDSDLDNRSRVIRSSESAGPWGLHDAPPVRGASSATPTPRHAELPGALMAAPFPRRSSWGDRAVGKCATLLPSGVRRGGRWSPAVGRGTAARLAASSRGSALATRVRRADTAFSPTGAASPGVGALRQSAAPGDTPAPAHEPRPAATPSQPGGGADNPLGIVANQNCNTCQDAVLPSRDRFGLESITRPVPEAGVRGRKA